MTSAVSAHAAATPVPEIRFTTATRNVLVVAALTAAFVAVASLLPSLVLGVVVLGTPIALIAALTVWSGSPARDDPSFILAVHGVPAPVR